MWPLEHATRASIWVSAALANCSGGDIVGLAVIFDQRNDLDVAHRALPRLGGVLGNSRRAVHPESKDCEGRENRHRFGAHGL
jgi:hypothetical protein